VPNGAGKTTVTERGLAHVKIVDDRGIESLRIVGLE